MGWNQQPGCKGRFLKANESLAGIGEEKGDRRGITNSGIIGSSNNIMLLWWLNSSDILKRFTEKASLPIGRIGLL